MGRYYDRWEGTQYYSGVTTDKNMLGVVCMVLGLGILSRFLETVRSVPRRNGKILAVGTLLGMNLWLLSITKSSTSLGCFLVGGTLIYFLNRFPQSRPAMVHLSVAGISLVGLAAYAFPSALAFFVHAAGRETTLTGRTELWNDLLAMGTNPWVGTGFESFFLGPRLDILWAKHWWRPNEAHNGYLETYLSWFGADGHVVCDRISQCFECLSPRSQVREPEAGIHSYCPYLQPH
jgi:O-antigen ligase